MKPKWNGGNPANTLAAMMDAREWLVTLRKMHRCGRAQFVAPSESVPALERCIESLDLAIAWDAEGGDE